MFSADGVLIGEFGEERRNFTPIAEIPKVMKDAVLAIEDARFYEHGGVDYKGVLRAGLANLSEVKSQGASTITMQVARNFYLSTEKTFTRKIYEVLLALKIESQLTKDQILEVYMNQIYLGPARLRLRRGERDLLRQAAARTSPSPRRRCWPACRRRRRRTTRSPTRSAPRSRQHYIIDRMHENGFITAEQAEAAHEAGAAATARRRDAAVHAEYVAETVRQLIYAQYGDEAYTRGLNVYTHHRMPPSRTVAYRALRKGIMDYERRQVYRGPEDYVDLPADPKELDARIAEALADHPDNDELMAAVVLEAVAEEGRRRAAERRVDHDHRRRPASRRRRACRDKANPKIADPAAAP